VYVNEKVKSYIDANYLNPGESRALPNGPVDPT